MQKLKHVLVACARWAIIGVSVAMAVPAGAAQDPQQMQFWSDMKDKKVPVDHIAKIGRYEYEIYTRKEGKRTLVSSTITQAGFDTLMNMSREERNRIIDEQNKLVHEYMSTISGVPPEPEPESKGMGHLSSPGRELARKIRGGGAGGQTPFDFSGQSKEVTIFDCPENFPQELRGEWDITEANSVGIDYWGRPGDSTVIWQGKPIGQERKRPCQQKVGYMGRATEDDGGHSVARFLGGWGGRANLTPQNLALNRKIFTRIDSAVEFCMLTNRMINSWTVMNLYRQSLASDIRPHYYQHVFYSSPRSCPPQWKEGPALWPQPANETPTADVYATVNEWTANMRAYCTVQANFPATDDLC